jgi:replicative DNA helicase
MNKLDESAATQDAEQILLGAILIDATGGNRDVIFKVSQSLQPWDFRGCGEKDSPAYWSVNPRIYYAMLQIVDPPNCVSVSLELVKLNLFEKEYPGYMAECEYMCPTSLDWELYAKAVKEYSLRRQARYFASTGNLKKLHEITKVKQFIGGVDGL